MSWTHERTEVHKTTVTHVGLNMFRFNEGFRKIRIKDKGCKLCHKPFVDEQFVHIAFTNKGNKLLCDSCSDKAIKGGATFIDKKGEL